MDIAEIRAGLGLTQAAFAQRLGVSPGHVGDLERGHRRLTVELAAKIEEVSDRRGIVDFVVSQKRADAMRGAA
jgi:transcriptional regulator with XRE-family HTH domain